jgi:hypothetical protein
MGGPAAAREDSHAGGAAGQDRRRCTAHGGCRYRGQRHASTSAWVAEEWTINIWVFVQAINTQILVLKRVLAGHEPVNADAVHTRPDGQVVVDVFPATGYDRLLLNGYKGQVWIEPGVNAEQTRAEAAALYRGTDPSDPEVCLVLGAGNLGTITALDIIDQLYIRGNVCAVKMNPINEYL